MNRRDTRRLQDGDPGGVPVPLSEEDMGHPSLHHELRAHHAGARRDERHLVRKGTRRLDEGIHLRVDAPAATRLGRIALVRESTGIPVVPDRHDVFRAATDTLTFPRGEGLPGRVYAKGEPEWVPDLAHAELPFIRSDSAIASGLVSGFALPVRIGDEVTAVLEFFSDVPLKSEDDLERIMRNVGAQTGRVLERRRARQELEAAQAKAAAANEAKSAFLARMSHELRTPMNAILGYSELLMEDPGLAAYTDDLEKIHGAGTHLLGLINDVLDLSKIESGKTEVHAERFRIDGR